MPKSSNAGPFVERCLRVTGTPVGSPWCAAYLAMVGTVALGSKWPVPKTAGCAALGEWAKEKKVLLPGKAVVGDTFLLYFPSLKRFAHMGLVSSVNTDGSIETIEGNAADPSAPSSREGWGVFTRTRTLGASDRVVRWSSLVSGG